MLFPLGRRRAPGTGRASDLLQAKVRESFLHMLFSEPFGLKQLSMPRCSIWGILTWPPSAFCLLRRTLVPCLERPAWQPFQDVLPSPPNQCWNPTTSLSAFPFNFPFQHNSVSGCCSSDQTLSAHPVHCSNLPHHHVALVFPCSVHLAPYSQRSFSKTLLSSCQDPACLEIQWN